MRISYASLALLALVASLWPRTAAAQATTCPATPECVVQWSTPGTGEPIQNALPATVANDTARPADRVYKLLRGGYYYQQQRISNGGFNLRIVGQTAAEGAANGQNVCGAGGNEDCGPAILQRFRNADGTVDALMIESSGDGNGGVTLQNVWLMGKDDTGVTANYEPITINSTNSRLTFDAVVFDRNDWHHLGIKGSGNDIFIRNSSFRNLAGPTQIYEGRGFRLEAGADTMIVENNTFLNIGFAPIQSEAVPINYFVFNHNTLVNFGRNLNAGAIWKEAYIANNILMNPFYQGESPAQYNDPTREDPFTGVFSIAALPGAFGLERDRRILLANNGYFRSSGIESAYGPLAIRAQPLVNDSTQSFFDLYEGMVIQNNLNADPGLTRSPAEESVYSLIRTLLNQYVNALPTPWAQIDWDPGRDPNPLANLWPLPENLTYSNSAFRTAGTDGLALGDLNWYPSDRQAYLNNRTNFIQALEDLAGQGPVPPTSVPIVQGEDGQLGNGATVATVQGTTDFDLQNGNVQWSFDLGNTSDVTIGLRTIVSLNATDNARGTRIFIDGTQINTQALYGETMFCRSDFIAYDGTTNCATLSGGFPLEAGTFGTVDFTAANLVAGASALTLTPGSHTVRIEAGWGGNFYVRNFQILDAGGTSIRQLNPADATANLVQQVCDTGTYCPDGFQWASLGSNGSVSWSFGFVADNTPVLPRLFFTSAGGATAAVDVDGVEVGTYTFAPNTSATSVELSSLQFNVGQGTHTLTVRATSGDLGIDRAIFNVYGQGVGTEEGGLGSGFALGAAYPNPSSGSARVRYEVGMASEVSLVVYDVLGRKVATLVEGFRPAGPAEASLDARQLSSGTYLVRYSTPVGVEVRTITVVR